MQSQLTKFLAVGLLALVLTCAVTVGESPAQWGRFSSPYVVNYNYHAGPYPVYAWRPLGGLLAGVHAGVHGLLCRRCWQSPCCCVTPMWCDPCFDPCFTCCDPCCDSCSGFGDYAASDCGCFGGFGYSGTKGFYEQPSSLSVGTLSSTGFGSVTPSDGVPGSRPVGTPAAQRAAQPPYGSPSGRSPLTTSQTAPDFTLRTNEPTRAPAPDEAFPSPTDNTNIIDQRLNDIPPRGTFTPNTDLYPHGAADIPPATRTGDDWYNSNSLTDGSQQDSDTGVAPSDGSQVPTGQGNQGTTNQPGTETGGGSTADSLLNFGTGTIFVTVPDNAKVYINGYETRMTGTNRRYAVNDLEPGQLYDYEVRIVALVNGRTVEETQWVTLAGGQQGLVAFGKPQPQSDNMRFVAARPAH